MPGLKLSTLALLLGLGLGLPQVYGLLNPAKFAAAVRKFPRSLPWGYALMLIGFAAVGLGTCVFVQDFLAVRGLAVVLLLLAKLMVDTGRPMLAQTHWVLVIQTWAYALVLGGMWFTVSPWRLRDFLEWATANEKRIKIGCGMRLAFGLFVAGLGILKY